MKTSEILRQAKTLLATPEEIQTHRHGVENAIKKEMYLCHAVLRGVAKGWYTKARSDATEEFIQSHIKGYAYATDCKNSSPEMEKLFESDQRAFYIEVQRRKWVWVDELIAKCESRGD